MTGDSIGAMGVRPPVPSVTSIDRTSTREIAVHFDDGSVARCNRFWLRDNCPSNGDRESLFRPFSVASLDDDLSIEAAEVTADGVCVTMSDGASDLFPPALLYRCLPAEAARTWVPWRRGADPSTIAFEQGLEGTAGHHRLLDALHRRGFAIVTGVPGEPAGTEIVASWLGPIRETDFGRVFDIVTEPDPFTPSQSSAALDPHTDDPYRYTPAGMSVLHCVTPCSGDGGASTIVDGFAVAMALAEREPASFDLLATVPVPYEHRRDESVDQGAAVHLRASGPVISLDEHGDVCGVRFHERSMAPLRVDPDLVDDFYRALAAFSRSVLGGEFAYEHRLAPGEAIVYDNQRVLHGRSAISGGTSRRHLRLCTVDRDQVHSRLRQLCERHAPGTEQQSLPAGCRS